MKTWAKFIGIVIAGYFAGWGVAAVLVQTSVFALAPVQTGKVPNPPAAYQQLSITRPGWESTLRAVETWQRRETGECFAVFTAGDGVAVVQLKACRAAQTAERPDAR